MTDRELIELAAKASGVESGPDDFTDELGRKYAPALGLWVRIGDLEHGHWWNPIGNDGDALRLAVACHIDIRHFMYRHGHMDCLVDRLGYVFQESLGDDPCAATRRAIVRAAAAIEKI